MTSYFNKMQLHPELTINVGRNNNIAVFATICGTIFIFQDLFSIVPISILGTWVVAQIVLSLFRLLIGYRLLKCTEADREWKLTTKLFILSTSLVGLGLGLSAVMAEVYGGVEEQLFIFAMLIAYSGAAVATLSPVIHGYIAHVLGIMLPQIYVLFFHFGHESMLGSSGMEGLMGYLGLLYVIIVIRAGMILHTTFYESIQLKNELAVAKDLAETANQAKSKFISSVSHELRTPLHAIMGSSQMLEIDKNLDEKGQTFVSLIKQAGDHLLSLIDQILEYSKVEAGKIQLKIVALNLISLLQECERLMQSIAQKHKVKLVVNLPEENIIFYNDPLRLKQIILNLISNAIKYNRQNGTVTVSVIQMEAKQIKISVEDTGHGISEELQPELFVSFNRLGRESGELEGTGIGLVICKNLIAAMGGTINFESTVDKGSTFWIELDTDFFNKP